MKQLTVIFTILTTLLLATSCSKDELPGSESTDEPGQMQTYTFTVSPDLMMEGDAETRSEGTQEEMPTRCFMQILRNNVYSIQTDESIENGKFTFSVELLSNTDYTFLFWADNNSGNTPADLREIQYTPGTVAFTAKVVNTPENMIENGIILKHVVTKLSLKTTEATSASEEESIKITTTCATTYNVDDPSASSYSEQTATKTFDTSTGFEANNNIATFYFIPKSETQSVDVEFHLLKQTIESVPLVANTYVTLQGDLSEGNPKWGATSGYVQKQISYFFTKGDGTSEGTPEGGVNRFYLPEDNLTDLEEVLSAIFHKDVELNLTSGGTIFNEVLDNDYTFSIRHNNTSKNFDILINGNWTYTIYYAPWNESIYENFSVVSNKLKNLTE